MTTMRFRMQDVRFMISLVEIKSVLLTSSEMLWTGAQASPATSPPSPRRHRIDLDGRGFADAWRANCELSTNRPPYGSREFVPLDAFNWSVHDADPCEISAERGRLRRP